MAQAPSAPVVGVTTYPSMAENGGDYWTANGVVAPQYAPIGIASAANITIVAASTGLKIRVLDLFLGNNAPCTVLAQDGAGVTLAGPIPMATVTQIKTQPATPYGVLETTAGAAFAISVAGTSPVVGGWCVYVKY